MPIKRLTVFAALVSVLLASGPLQAKIDAPAQTHASAKAHVAAKAHTAAKSHTKKTKTHTAAKVRATAKTQAQTNPPAIAIAVAPLATQFAIASPLLNQQAGFNNGALLPQAAAPTASFGMLLARDGKATTVPAAVGSSDKQSGDDTQSPASGNGESVTGLRKALIALAMDLRDPRYVRGGRDPSTGFDCSGFVRYVFAHAIGMKLPTNSASQFLDGLKIKRADMKPGDLVFFHTGRKQRISHVGIYISNGRFIHSPATGKSVQVSSLDESYWAKHFAGAKRPQAMAMALAHNG